MEVELLVVVAGPRHAEAASEKTTNVRPTKTAVEHFENASPASFCSVVR